MNCNKFAILAMMGVLGSSALLAAEAVKATLPPGCTLADRESVRLDPERFTVKSPLQICDVPLKGWNVVFPLAPEYKDLASTGITVEQSTAVIGGKEVPTLVITCKKGTYKTANNSHPVIELPFKFNASEWNILSFIAKVETTPEDLGPKGFGMDWPRYGLDASFYGKFIDGFGVAIQDQYYDWAAWAVPTTYFPYHHVRRDDKGLDGFKSFQWDMENDDIACNKKPILTQVRALRFFYNTLKLKDRESVKITIANLRLAKGAATKVDDAERYIAWKNWVKNYEPDYSDSSKYLLPPEEGRIAKPIQLAKDGKALAEIVVDLSDKVKIDNWVPAKYRSVELNVARGTEFGVAAEAANELKLWLDKITGADFEIRRTPSKDKKPRIYLGASFAAPFFKEDIDKLAAAEAIDGYAVREKDGDIYIFGTTPAGTRNGVFAFLENNSDIIWPFYSRGDNPDETAVYTVNPNLTAVWGDDIDIPVFISRGFSGANHKFLSRLRNYFYVPTGGHILSPQYYDHSEGCRIFNPILFGEKEKYQKWSEYSALICMNEPELDDYMKEWMHDKRFSQGARFAYMDGLDDNYGYCNCEKCTEPFVGLDGRTITPTEFNEFWSTWLFRHYNKLADGRASYWPGYESGGFCYFMSAHKPAIEVSDNYKRPWLCTYVRKSQCVPIFAPINQHWWQYYKDWTAHSPNCHLYDYYLLFAKIHPIAEVLKFDLMGMRDLHFLRIMSENCGSNEYMGLADERWCISRLYWNPDDDLEQLHRYFNRRVYHEAAPWVDKFRGEIRRAWFQRFKQDIEFEGSDVANMIREFGMEQELRGYLEEAYKAINKPGANLMSKYAVERMCQEFVKYMNDGALTAQNSIPGVPLESKRYFVSKKKGYDRPERNISYDWRKAQLTTNLVVYVNNYSDYEEDFYALNTWLNGRRMTNDVAQVIKATESFAAFGDAKTSPQKNLARVYKEANAKQVKEERIAYLKEQLNVVPLSVRPKVLSMLGSEGVKATEIYPTLQSLAWVKDYLAEVESNPEVLTSRIKYAIGLYAGCGYIDEVQSLYYSAFRDRRDERRYGNSRINMNDAVNSLRYMIENYDIPTSRAIQYINVLSFNHIDEAIGWMTDEGFADRARFLNVGTLMGYAKRGVPEKGAEIIKHYRNVDAKSPRADWASHQDSLLCSYWKEVLKQKNIDTAKYQAKLDEATRAWNDALRVTIKDGYTRTIRGNAKKQLLWNEWDTISQGEKIVRLNELIADKWMNDWYRQEAAKRIKSIYENGDTVEWKRYADHVFYAITLGNWSHAAEFVTRHNGNDDFRLDFVIAETKKMKEAGQKQLAIQTLRRAGEYLDYRAGNEKVKPYNFAPNQFLKRLERYNNALQELQR